MGIEFRDTSMLDRHSVFMRLKLFPCPLMLSIRDYLCVAPTPETAQGPLSAGSSSDTQGCAEGRVTYLHALGCGGQGPDRLRVKESEEPGGLEKKTDL